MNKLAQEAPQSFRGRMFRPDSARPKEERILVLKTGIAGLQFHIKNWSYDTAGQGRYLPCRVEGGQETGRTFGAQLWAVAEKLDCIG